MSTYNIDSTSTYSIDSTSASSCGLLIFGYGFLAAAFALLPTEVGSHVDILDQDIGVEWNGSQYINSVHSRTSASVLVKQGDLNFDFQSAVTDFYSNLVGAQENLGDDFSKVLVDNLWNLYARA